MVKYSMGHSDLAGIDNYYIHAPFLGGKLNHVQSNRLVKEDRPAHSMMTDICKENSFKVGANKYSPKHHGDIQTMKKKIRYAETKAPRTTIISEIANKQSFFPCGNDYKPEWAFGMQ